MRKLKQTKGITLVALVITIIILLILAGISIQAITNTGIFTQANNAKRESEIANIKEQIVLDIYEKQLEPPVGSITEDQLETILGKYGTIIYEEDGVTIKGITTAKGYEILLKDIYGGETVAESVPDGAIVNPVNDITTWLKTGEISKQYSYTTIEQVIADSTCIQSLMNNENAMKYLARSTEFANVICASETTMTYLGQSAYVEDTVLNSDNWVSVITASQYWTLVYTTVYTIHAGASETITIDGVCGSFTTNSDGTVSHALPLGELILHGSVSNEYFTRTITKETMDVYVMPETALYWYGNECSNFTGGWVTGDYHDFHSYNVNSGKLQSNQMYFSYKGASNYSICIQSMSCINLSNYSSLCVNVSSISTSYTSPYLALEAYDSSKNMTGKVGNVSSQVRVETLDISSVAELGYINLRAVLGNSSSAYLTVDKIWLE